MTVIRTETHYEIEELEQESTALIRGQWQHVPAAWVSIAIRNSAEAARAFVAKYYGGQATDEVRIIKVTTTVELEP